jgi:hypothetical protein
MITDDVRSWSGWCPAADRARPLPGHIMGYHALSRDHLQAPRGQLAAPAPSLKRLSRASFLHKLYNLCKNGCMAVREVLAAEARRDFSAVLDDVEHHGTHVKVQRYTTVAAVMVPPDWYARAAQALAASGEPDPPPG